MLTTMTPHPPHSYQITRYSDSRLFRSCSDSRSRHLKVFLFQPSTEVYQASNHGAISLRLHFPPIYLCMRSEVTQTWVSFVSVPGATGSWKHIHCEMVSWAWKSYDTANWDSTSIRLSHTLKQICFEAINQCNRVTLFITHVGLRGPRSANSRSHTAKKLISWCALRVLVSSLEKEIAEPVLCLFYRPSDSPTKE